MSAVEGSSCTCNTIYYMNGACMCVCACSQCAIKLEKYNYTLCRYARIYTVHASVDGNGLRI